MSNSNSNSNQWYVGQDGEKYLSLRKSSLSEHVQSLRASLFSDLSNDKSVVLDFGCGSGGILKRVSANRRIGVEVSESATKIALSEGVEVHSSIKNLADACVDVGISFHALEHVDNPLEILKEIKRVVKSDGIIRIIVPCETPFLSAQRSWRPNLDRHLYTWTPLLLGNLAERAGLKDISVRFAPMPTGSRLVRRLRFIPLLSKTAHFLICFSQNRLNVILDAKSPL